MTELTPEMVKIMAAEANKKISEAEAASANVPGPNELEPDEPASSLLQEMVQGPLSREAEDLYNKIVGPDMHCAIRAAQALRLQPDAEIMKVWFKVLGAEDRQMEQIVLLHSAVGLMLPRIVQSAVAGKHL